MKVRNISVKHKQSTFETTSEDCEIFNSLSDLMKEEPGKEENQKVSKFQNFQKGTNFDVYLLNTPKTFEWYRFVEESNDK